MRKIISFVMLAVLTMLAGCSAYAEAAYRVAGYDHEDTGHVWETNLFFERMQEITGVELELTQYTTLEKWNAAKAAMFADGGDLPDALFKANLTVQETMELYEAGKIIDLRPYLEQHAPNLWTLLTANPDWMEAVTLPGGAIAALPAIDELQFNNAMWINQNWLNRLGMKAPTTVDELLEVLRAFQSGDLNGNGKRNDEIPFTFSSLWDLRFLLHAFGVNANDYYVSMDEGGKVSEILTSDANRAFLSWLHLMWEEKLLDQNGFTGLRDLSAKASNDENETAVYGVMLSSTPVELVSANLLQDYVLLAPLTCDGRQVYRDLTGDVIRGTFAITSACKDPAGMVAWVDTLYTTEGFILAECGLEGEDYVWNDDGTWMWEISVDLLADHLRETSIRSGISMPGYASVTFQQSIDDAATLHVVNNLVALKDFDSLPYPQVYLTREQQARVDELIYQIGSYAERQMVWFITGDHELNDESWAAFCQKVKDLGVDEMIAIFQTAADTQR